MRMKRISQSIFYWTAFVCILLSACTQHNSNQAKKNSKPNFIIIFTDDLGYGDLGCFGHPTIKTPRLDQMANEGMKLTQFYVGSSICTPSRAALLTGRLPVRSGMYGHRRVLYPDNAGGLQDDEITIGEALQEEEYKTACIGKWHLGHLEKYRPLSHGFDHFYGILYSNDMHPQNKWDPDNPFPPLMLIEGNNETEEIIDQSELTNQFTDEAIRFMEDNSEDPFFLYLPFTAPHVPLHVSKENQKSIRGKYGDVVENIDFNVGKILDYLNDNKLSENTFVLFTSDNGPWAYVGLDGGSAGHLKGSKGGMWEGGFKVPTIAYMPGTISENQVCSSIGTTMDLFPTILGMAQVEGDSNLDFDGMDITETFKNCQALQNKVYYYREEELIAYREGQWKIFINDPDVWDNTYSQKDMPLLYNLELDPSESKNVAEGNSEIVERMINDTKEHIAQVEIPPSQLTELLKKPKQ